MDVRSQKIHEDTEPSATTMDRMKGQKIATSGKRIMMSRAWVKNSAIPCSMLDIISSIIVTIIFVWFYFGIMDLMDGYEYDVDVFMLYSFVFYELLEMDYTG